MGRRTETGPPRRESELLWALRKADSEMLTRHELQSALLDELFTSREFLFSSPANPSVKVPFGRLYHESVLASSKISAALRALVSAKDTPFPINFCKLCFLVNTGRINTTLAFYPAMKTALRTYHPIPSLQPDEATRTQMQDAPRLKAILKGCVLSNEGTKPPATLREVAVRAADPNLSGPPTSVVNLVFLLFAIGTPETIATKYFHPGVGLFDIFYPSDVPFRPRARAFLTLVHHMLENNRFIDDFDSPAPTSPPFITLTLDVPPGTTTKLDNVDTEAELAYAREMKESRVSTITKAPPAPINKDGIVGRVSKLGASKDSDSVTDSAKKRRRVAGVPVDISRSYARALHNAAQGSSNNILPPGWQTQDYSRKEPVGSTLLDVWGKIKHELVTNTDPDYDSDTEGSWPYDLLLKRSLLTVVNPATGNRGPIQDVKEFTEWNRRREHGYVEEEPAVQALEEVEHGGSDDGDE